MGEIDLVTRLSHMIEKAEKSGEFKIANGLSHLMIDVIDERSKEWKKGYAIGYRLGVRDAELRGYKTDNNVK